MGSIFPELSLDRTVSRWEEHLMEPTPWEFHQGVWFKREDHFAPLGLHGPNGSKMRQLIWMVNTSRPGRERIVTGASVQSPQLSMTAIVGAHYGLPVHEVVYSKPHTLMGHPNPAIAAGFGATFEYVKGPYNPIIQARVDHLAACDATALKVEYGISLPISRYSPEEVLGFHSVGANQVWGMPPQVRRLIVPAGSCNSLTSILLGLIWARGKHDIDELYTLGIGPDKRAWALERLRYMGVDPDNLPFRWKHHSLHETGFSTYSEKFKGERFRGIDFHPTYEAKMWRYLRRHDPIPQDGSTGFWIVGAEARPEVVRPFYTTTETEETAA